MALVQKPNFSCTEPNAEIIITYFVSSLTEMSIFRPLNLIQVQLRSVTESIIPAAGINNLGLGLYSD